MQFDHILLSLQLIISIVIRFPLSLYPITFTYSVFSQLYDEYGLKHFAPVLFLVLYSVIGACLFCVIEKPHEVLVELGKRDLRDRARAELVTGLELLLFDPHAGQQAKLGATRDLVLAYERRLKLDDQHASPLQWDMWGALFYVGTIYTTIGGLRLFLILC